MDIKDLHACSFARTMKRNVHSWTKLIPYVKVNTTGYGTTQNACKQLELKFEEPEPQTIHNMKNAVTWLQMNCVRHVNAESNAKLSDLLYGNGRYLLYPNVPRSRKLR